MEGETKSIQLPKPIVLNYRTWGTLGQKHVTALILEKESGERVEWQIPTSLNGYKGQKIKIRSKRVEGLEGYIEINDSRKNLDRKAEITAIPKDTKRVLVKDYMKTSGNVYVNWFEYDIKTGELKPIEIIEEVEVD